MKISIIGGGNVGGLTAMRLAQEGLGDIFLIDLIKGLAQGKSFDLEDARSLLKRDYCLCGSQDIKEISDSDIIVVTAGLTRKPEMTREDLLRKNIEILKDISLNIKNLAPNSIVIVVTNPLDIMTYFVLKKTGFSHHRVLGMGVSLDAARFANLISKELNLSPLDVEACVIGSHGEAMLPLSRFTTIRGVALDEFLGDKKIQGVIQKTIERGREIISLLGSGSAYFAPSAAITTIVRAIIKDEKRAIGVSAYLNGEYGARDICIGVPCRLGKEGIEKIIELDLKEEEKKAFLKSVEVIRHQYRNLTV